MEFKYEDFVKYYKKYSKCINDINVRKKPLNEKQLKTRYEKYLKSITRKIRKKSIDEKWQSIREIVYNRDFKRCRLSLILTPKEYSALKQFANTKIDILDPAHIFKISLFPEIKYNPDYIVLLNRFSHENLDNYKCPLTGVHITKDETNIWWKRICGKNNYRFLRNNLNKENHYVNVTKIN